VHDTSSESGFTKSGLNPPAIPYLFLAGWHGDTGNINRSPNEITSKIFINKDPVVFSNINEGDELNFNIYAEDLDKLMVTYENPVKKDSLIYEIRNQINFENNMNYTVPEGYYGKITVTANGYKNGLIKAMDTIHFNVGVPSNITLQGIHFEDSRPAIYSQNEYSYNLIGSFSDGIERIINNYVGVMYSIEDNAIISQIDNNTIKGELVGTSILTASINGLEDSILVKVRENPSLQQTILVNFHGTPNTGNTSIDIFWETLQEYQNATFVLETSYGTPDNFTEINQQAGNGTTNTPAQFNFEDTTFGANTLIYYRIKMIDTSGNFVYSSTIEINLAITLGVDGEDLSSIKLELYPNPVKTNEVTLKLDSKFTDKNAKLTLYSLQGKRLSVQTLNVIEGANSFKLKIGEGLTNGIYLVRVSTTNYIKTVKLIVEK